jgi:single-strand DNA-binding protein
MNDIPITIVGNVCTDPNMTPTTAGVPRATFRVASNPRRLKDGVWVDGDPTYVTVICFRSLAENVVASIGKGDPIVVTGRLRTREWTGEKQGLSVEIDATSVGFDLARGTGAFVRARRESNAIGPADAELVARAVEAGLTATAIPSELRTRAA